MNFEINEQQNRKIQDWISAHDKECKFSDPFSCGAIGGRFAYEFTPTGLGMIVNVKCACGEKLDLTEYDLW